MALVGGHTLGQTGHVSDHNLIDAALAAEVNNRIAGDASLVTLALTNYLGLMFHGAVANAPRTAGAAQVLWVGTVNPTNALTNDLFLDKSANPYALKVYNGSVFTSLTGAAAGAVTSVAGKTGAVTLIPADITGLALSTLSFWASGSTYPANYSLVNPNGELVTTLTALGPTDTSSYDPTDYSTPASGLYDPIGAAAAAQSAAAADATNKANAALAAATVNALTITTRSGTTYTLVSGDANTLMEFGNAAGCTVTVPLNSTTAFAIGSEFELMQYGAGQVIIAGGGSAASVSIPGTASSFNNSAATTHTITIPSTLVDHDGMLVEIEHAGSRTWTPPTNWVQVGSQIGPSGANSTLFKRVDASVSEANTTITFTVASGGAIPTAMALIILRGVDRTDFIDGIATTAATNTQTAPALTTSAAGCVEISIPGKSSAATAYSSPAFTPPSGITEDVEGFTNGGSANCAVAFGHGTLAGVPAGTSIGNRTWSAGYGNARTVSVKPNTTTGPTILSRGSAFKTAGQYGIATLTKIDTDTWVVSGDVVT